MNYYKENFPIIGNKIDYLFISKIPLFIQSCVQFYVRDEHAA